MESLIRERIMHLRSTGESYARIAEMLDVSINTVKSHCRRNSISQVDAERFVEKDIVRCQHCGTALTHTPGKKRKRFCADQCRMVWWKENRNTVKQTAWHETKCSACDKTFHSYGNRHRKFCSHACYIKARFGRAGA